MQTVIGTIMSGSLTEGFSMRVTSRINLEDLKTGKFVCIVGKHYKFFSMITDLSLHVSHPDILLFPPSDKEPLLNALLQEKDMYATATLRPMLMLEGTEKRPVKTIPHHFASVYDASVQDVAHIFGSEDDPSKRYFNIGSPLDMQTPVCLDLDRLTERSNGIFGKTGTGKTFITRLILAGLIKIKKR